MQKVASAPPYEWPDNSNRLIHIFYKVDKMVVDEFPCLEKATMYRERNRHVLVWLFSESKVVFPICFGV